MLTTLTLVTVALVVVALATSLVAILVALVAAKRAVAGVADALEAVEKDTRPLEEKLVIINGALSALDQGLVGADGHLLSAARAFRLV